MVPRQKEVVEHVFGHFPALRDAFSLFESSIICGVQSHAIEVLCLGAQQWQRNVRPVRYP
jgi:hypothetical protein